MAVSHIMGFESGRAPSATSNDGEILHPGAGSAASFQATTVRSGAYALRCNASAAQMYLRIQQRDSAGAFTSFCQSARFALRVGALPSANTQIFRQHDGTNVQDCLYLNTDGSLSVARNTTVDATSANALSADGLWHLIEFDCGWNGGSGRRVYVDGVEWATNNATASTPRNRAEFGVCIAATADLYFDDLVVEDDTLASLWPDWKVIWLPAISDSAIGAWTGGAGGTTNLYDALDNVPPVAVAAGSDTNTSQIQSASGSGTDAYDANVRSYATAGITAGDTIRAVQALAVHAEGVATGTKTGDLQIVSNPAASAKTFAYGNDNGLAGTYASLWKGSVSTAVESPSVTLGTSPVVRVRKTDVGTRETHVAWLGAYVAYSPGTKARPFYRRPWRVWGRRVA